MATTHEVWARAAWAASDLAALGGLPDTGVFDGLPFDADSVRELKRVAWDDYCTLVENIGKLAGDGLEDLLEASYHQVFPELRAAFGALVDTKALLRFVSTIANPLMFPPVESRFEDLGGRHVRLTARLRSGARPCEVFFRGTIGGWRGFPRHLEQPPAQATALVAPDHAVYDLVLPPDRTLLGRIRTDGLASIVRFALGRESDGSTVTATFGGNSDDSLEKRMRAAERRWKLTPRQLEVLRRLASGGSDREIAEALGCEQTIVEIVIAQLLQKTGSATRDDLIERLWKH